MNSRLKQIRKHLQLKQNEMAEILDCSTGNISMIESGKSVLSERNKRLLVKKFNLNPLWLDGENVPMLLPGAEHSARVDNSAHPEGRSIRASVPLFDIESIDSLADLFRLTSASGGKLGKRGRPGRMTSEERSHRPLGWISLPGLPDCDGALKLVGEAMNPILRNGDIVIYKQLDFTSEIFWGDMYLLSMETSAGEYITVRYIRRSPKDGYAILAGEDPSFADTEIELSKINALAVVKASVRMNYAK